MTREEIVDFIRRLGREMHEEHRVEDTPRWFAADMLDRRPPAPDVAGYETLMADHRALIAGFPDYVMRPVAIDLDGDWAAVTWLFDGTHAGQFRIFAPTGRRCTLRRVVVYRIEDGLVRERWQSNRLGDHASILRAAVEGRPPPDPPTDDAGAAALVEARGGRG